jgi:hypothetical protein
MKKTVLSLCIVPFLTMPAFADSLVVVGKPMVVVQLATLEADGRGAPCLVCCSRLCSGTRALCQRAKRAADPLRFRVRLGEACPHREQAMPFANDQADISTCLAAQLCANDPASHKRPPEGLVVARSCQYENDRDLHASWPVNKARSTRCGHATIAALGTVPG